MTFSGWECAAWSAATHWLAETVALSARLGGSPAGLGLWDREPSRTGPCMTRRGWVTLRAHTLDLHMSTLTGLNYSMALLEDQRTPGSAVLVGVQHPARGRRDPALQTMPGPLLSEAFDREEASGQDSYQLVLLQCASGSDILLPGVPSLVPVTIWRWSLGAGVVLGSAWISADGDPLLAIVEARHLLPDDTDLSYFVRLVPVAWPRHDWTQIQLPDAWCPDLGHFPSTIPMLWIPGTPSDDPAEVTTLGSLLIANLRGGLCSVTLAGVTQQSLWRPASPTRELDGSSLVQYSSSSGFISPLSNPINRISSLALESPSASSATDSFTDSDPESTGGFATGPAAGTSAASSLLGSCQPTARLVPLVFAPSAGATSSIAHIRRRDSTFSAQFGEASGGEQDATVPLCTASCTVRGHAAVALGFESGAVVVVSTRPEDRGAVLATTQRRQDSWEDRHAARWSPVNRYGRQKTTGVPVTQVRCAGPSPAPSVVAASYRGLADRGAAGSAFLRPTPLPPHQLLFLVVARGTITQSTDLTPQSDPYPASVSVYVLDWGALSDASRPVDLPIYSVLPAGQRRGRGLPRPAGSVLGLRSARTARTGASFSSSTAFGDQSRRVARFSELRRRLRLVQVHYAPDSEAARLYRPPSTALLDPTPALHGTSPGSGGHDDSSGDEGDMGQGDEYLQGDDASTDRDGEGDLGGGTVGWSASRPTSPWSCARVLGWTTECDQGGRAGWAGTTDSAAPLWRLWILWQASGVVSGEIWHCMVSVPGPSLSWLRPSRLAPGRQRGRGGKDRRGPALPPTPWTRQLQTYQYARLRRSGTAPTWPSLGQGSRSGLDSEQESGNTHYYPLAALDRHRFVYGGSVHEGLLGQAVGWLLVSAAPPALVSKHQRSRGRRIPAHTAFTRHISWIRADFHPPLAALQAVLASCAGPAMLVRVPGILWLSAAGTGGLPGTSAAHAARLMTAASGTWIRRVPHQAILTDLLDMLLSTDQLALAERSIALLRSGSGVPLPDVASGCPSPARLTDGLASDLQAALLAVCSAGPSPGSSHRLRPDVRSPKQDAMRTRKRGGLLASPLGRTSVLILPPDGVLDPLALAARDLTVRLIVRAAAIFRAAAIDLPPGLPIPDTTTATTSSDPIVCASPVTALPEAFSESLEAGVDAAFETTTAAALAEAVAALRVRAAALLHFLGLLRAEATSSRAHTAANTALAQLAPWESVLTRAAWWYTHGLIPRASRAQALAPRLAHAWRARRAWWAARLTRHKAALPTLRLGHGYVSVPSGPGTARLRHPHQPQHHISLSSPGAPTVTGSTRTARPVPPSQHPVSASPPCLLGDRLWSHLLHSNHGPFHLHYKHQHSVDYGPDRSHRRAYDRFDLSTAPRDLGRVLGLLWVAQTPSAADLGSYARPTSREHPFSLFLLFDADVLFPSSSGTGSLSSQYAAVHGIPSEQLVILRLLWALDVGDTQLALASADDSRINPNCLRALDRVVRSAESEPRAAAYKDDKATAAAAGVVYWADLIAARALALGVPQVAVHFVRAITGDPQYNLALPLLPLQTLPEQPRAPPASSLLSPSAPTPPSFSGSGGGRPLLTTAHYVALQPGAYRVSARLTCLLCAPDLDAPEAARAHLAVLRPRVRDNPAWLALAIWQWLVMLWTRPDLAGSALDALLRAPQQATAALRTAFALALVLAVNELGRGPGPSMSRELQHILTQTPAFLGCPLPHPGAVQMVRPGPSLSRRLTTWLQPAAAHQDRGAEPGPDSTAWPLTAAAPALVRRFQHESWPAPPQDTWPPLGRPLADTGRRPWWVQVGTSHPSLLQRSAPLIPTALLRAVLQRDLTEPEPGPRVPPGTFPVLGPHLAALLHRTIPKPASERLVSGPTLTDRLPASFGRSPDDHRQRGSPQTRVLPVPTTARRRRLRRQEQRKDPLPAAAAAIRTVSTFSPKSSLDGHTVLVQRSPMLSGPIRSPSGPEAILHAEPGLTEPEPSGKPIVSSEPTPPQPPPTVSRTPPKDHGVPSPSAHSSPHRSPSGDVATPTPPESISKHDDSSVGAGYQDQSDHRPPAVSPATGTPAPTQPGSVHTERSVSVPSEVAQLRPTPAPAPSIDSGPGSLTEGSDQAHSRPPADSTGTAAVVPTHAESLSSLSYRALQTRLKRAGLPSRGRKTELVARLARHIDSSTPHQPPSPSAPLSTSPDSGHAGLALAGSLEAATKPTMTRSRPPSDPSRSRSAHSSPHRSPSGDVATPTPPESISKHDDSSVGAGYQDQSDHRPPAVSPATGTPAPTQPGSVHTERSVSVPSEVAQLRPTPAPAPSIDSGPGSLTEGSDQAHSRPPADSTGTAAVVPTHAESLSSLSYRALQTRLKRAGLPSRGRKTELVARLARHIDSSTPHQPPAPAAPEAEAAGRPSPSATTDVTGTSSAPPLGVDATTGQPTHTESLSSLSYRALQIRLKRAGLPSRGKKTELVVRLARHIDSSTPHQPPAPAAPEAEAAGRPSPSATTDVTGTPSAPPLGVDATTGQPTHTESLSSLSYRALQIRLKRAGLPSRGKKTELVVRLAQHLASQ